MAMFNSYVESKTMFSSDLLLRFCFPPEVLPRWILYRGITSDLTKVPAKAPAASSTLERSNRPRAHEAASSAGRNQEPTNHQASCAVNAVGQRRYLRTFDT